LSHSGGGSHGGSGGGGGGGSGGSKGKGNGGGGGGKDRDRDRERDGGAKHRAQGGGGGPQDHRRRKHGDEELFDGDDRDEALVMAIVTGQASHHKFGVNAIAQMRLEAIREKTPERLEEKHMRENIDTLTAEVYRRTEEQVERDAPPGLMEVVRGELEDDDELNTKERRRKRERERRTVGGEASTTPHRVMPPARLAPPPQPAIVAVEEPKIAPETVERMRDSLWALLLRAPHNVTISRQNQLGQELDFFSESASDDFADPDEVGKDLGKKG
jgi:hypothetical protein